MHISNDFSKVKESLKDLPVISKVPEVLQSVSEGKVTILTAETGSGKTLLASSALADASDHPVWVLVPRRFLAINAAKAIAELSGKTLGEEVGYAIGRKTTDRSKFSDKSKLIFATYGYALSAGILDDPHTQTIICDEVHEAGIDTSLARAIIHKRLQTDPKLHVVEMSATLNAEKQASYWEDVAQTAIHHADGKTFECDYRHLMDTEKSLVIATRDLLREVASTEYKNVAADNQQKGIAVFVDGVRVAETLAEQLRALCKESHMRNVEVATIYADMDEEQRDKALAPPAEGDLKILVGTPVIESGMNIKWLRAGISNGLAKVPYYRENGAEALIPEQLPQWRLTQQEGRVKRFDKGIFILHSAVKKEERPTENSPEITRISLKGLVMYAANYGINPTELKFDAPVATERLKTAKQDLIHLQLLNDDWTLTEKGRFAISLPLRPEIGAMMWAAKEKFPAIMEDAITLAAVAEAGNMTPLFIPKNEQDERSRKSSLRADMRIGHNEDSHSDVLDAFKAYKKVAARINEDVDALCRTAGITRDAYKHLASLGRPPLEEECLEAHITLEVYKQLGEEERALTENRCAESNMSVMSYKTARELIVDLHRRMDPEMKIEQAKPAKDQQLIQIMLYGSVNHLLSKDKYGETAGYRVLSGDNRVYREDKYTVTAGTHEPYAIGNLREIGGQKPGKGEVIATNLTRVSSEALREFVASRPDILTGKTIVSKGHDKFVQGKWLGGGEVAFKMPGPKKKPNPDIEAILRSMQSKPKGMGNSGVVDHAADAARQARIG